MGRNVVIASGTFITCEKHAGIAILRTVYTCNFCHVQYLLRSSCSFNRVCDFLPRYCRGFEHFLNLMQNLPDFSGYVQQYCAEITAGLNVRFEVAALRESRNITVKCD